jgi:DNA-binding MarR family transcriptional regulator
MFKPLDPLLHAELRLAVMSLLISVKEAEFKYLKEKTGATSGNMSVQLNKLAEAGYVDIVKSYRNNYPLTTCSITTKGLNAFQVYVDSLKSYIDQKQGSD